MRLLFALLAFISNDALSQVNERSTIVKAKTGADEVATGNTYAVIVGVDQYKEFPRLRFAVRDAKLFMHFLQSPAGGNVPAENIRYYFDDSASTGALDGSCIEWLNTKRIRKGDRIFFYLAGHGDEYKKQLFFFTHDAKNVTGRRNYKIQGNIDITQLKEYLLSYVEEDGAEIVFIIDACRTSMNDSVTAAMADRVGGYLEADVVHKGFYSLYSTSGGAAAFESAALEGGHGFFTYYLVQGGLGIADTLAMGNKDGKISIEEFALYPKKVVPDSTEKQLNLQKGNGQVPEFKGVAAETKILFRIHEEFRLSLAADNLDDALSRRVKEKIGSPVVAVRRSSSDKIEGAELKTYNSLIAALVKKDLYGGPNSAWNEYQSMLRNWPASRWTEESRLMLIAELINFSKDVIDLYLLGADTRLIEQKASGNSLSAGMYSQLVRASVADFTTAANYTEKAISLLGENNPVTQHLLPRLWFLKSRSFIDGNRKISLPEAIALAENALQFDSNAVHLYHLLAILEVKRNNIEKAEYYFVKAMEGETSYTKTASELGYSFFKLKRFDEASTYYRIRNLDAKEFAAAYNTLALISLDRGNRKEAERYFRKGLSYDAKAAYLRRNLAIFYETNADAANRSDKLLEAEYYYKLACDPALGYPSSLINFGNFYSDQKVRQYAKALACYESVLRSDPKNVLALHNLAILYYNNAIRNRSQALVDRAIAVSSEIVALDGGGKYATDASVRISNAQRMRPKFAPNARGLFDDSNPLLTIDTAGASLAAAKKLLQVKQFDAAERILRRLITGNKPVTEALVAMAEVYKEKEQLDSAIVFMEYAYRNSPGNVALAIEVVGLHLLNGNTKRARQFLAPLVQADPYNASLVLWLGYVYEQDNNLASAEAVYQSFYYKYPKHPEVLERLYLVSLNLGRSAQAERFRRELMQIKR